MNNDEKEKKSNKKKKASKTANYKKQNNNNKANVKTKYRSDNEESICDHPLCKAFENDNEVEEFKKKLQDDSIHAESVKKIKPFFTQEWLKDI